MVVYVNGRENSLVTGLKVALDEVNDNTIFELSDYKELMKGLGLLTSTILAACGGCIGAEGAATTLVGMTESIIGGAISLKTIVDAICNNEDEVDSKLVQLLVKIAKEKQSCLIVDEANLIFSGDEASQTLLALISSQTKEKSNMTMFLMPRLPGHACRWWHSSSSCKRSLHSRAFSKINVAFSKIRVSPRNW
jgi:hypothetical protein